MKKLLAMLLVFVLAFSMVACGTDEQAAEPNEETKEEKTEESKEETSEKPQLKPEEGATLKVWESEGPEGEFIKMVGEAFEEEYGVEVTYEAVGTTDARARLAQDGPAGVGADVFAMPHDHLGSAFNEGLVFPNVIGADRVKNDYMDAANKGVSFDGKVYGYPTAIETYALFYNKNLMNEAPQTFEEIIEFGKKYNDPANNKYALIWDVANAYFSHGFITANGGYVFGDGGTNPEDIGLANDGAINGLKQMLKLKEILPLQAGDANYDVMDGLFQEGKVATIINGPWAVQGYKDAEVNFGIAPLPTVDGNNPGSFSGIRGLYVSSYTEYPQAAQLFAKFATSDDMLLKRFEMTKQIPPVKTLMDNPTISNNELVKPFLEQAQYAVPMPSISEVQTMWDPYGAALASAWNGDQTAKEALEKAVQTMEESIDAMEE